MNKRIRVWLILGLCFTFLVGLCLMLYPLVSSWYTEKTSSEVKSEYVSSVETIDTSRIDLAWNDAIEFNERLFKKEVDVLKPEENGYYDLLDLSGTGIIGYISIPSIDVSLPIFHGTSEAVLKVGAGHMPQSSLPVGGDSTHTVITAHSGMASNPMFSDIPLLLPGDIFQIEILGKVLTYQIQSEEDIKIVKPTMIDDISVLEGEDLCTLITCYPFGVNTERYLVRGHRIPTPEIEETISVEELETTDPAINSGSVWREQYISNLIFGLLVGLWLVLLMTAILLICKLRRSGKKKARKR